MEGEAGIAREAFSSKELKAAFSLNPGTLANLRSRGEGPKYYRVGRKILYLKTDIMAWLRSNPGA